MAEKIKYLDGLRGLAAFAVFIGHFTPLFIICTSYFVSVFVAIFFFGRLFAVSIFFILSGYVLTYAFFKTGKEEILVSGAVRRYIRLLVPVSFLFLLIYIFVYPGFPGHANTDSIKDLLSQMFWGVFVHGQYAFVPGQDSYTGVLWTMTIEFIGSFIVFSFASLFGKLRNRWVFYIAAIAFFIHTYYLAFILGMILADHYNNESARKARIENPGILIGLFIAGILLGTYPSIPLVSNIYTVIGNAGDLILAIPFAASSPVSLGIISSMEFLYIIGAFLILVVLLNSRLLEELLSSRIPVFLGKISFSLYLIHMVVINTFSFFILEVIFNNQLTFQTGIFVFLLTLPVLLLASYLMYRFVDMPGITFAKYMYSRFFGKTGTRKI
jgi:peptidoglycan/LPS O-acetylase OafA/YrhL